MLRGISLDADTQTDRPTDITVIESLSSILDATKNIHAYIHAYSVGVLGRNNEIKGPKAQCITDISVHTGGHLIV